MGASTVIRVVGTIPVVIGTQYCTIVVMGTSRNSTVIVVGTIPVVIGTQYLYLFQLSWVQVVI